ncbi:hypothetical protein F01_530218 [Burkholderia cenocepacia]|nr:hypothetical protein F01_530218 [Burkholderia cenocepacia]
MRIRCDEHAVCRRGVDPTLTRGLRNRYLCGRTAASAVVAGSSPLLFHIPYHKVRNIGGAANDSSYYYFKGSGDHSGGCTQSTRPGVRRPDRIQLQRGNGPV